MPAPERPFATAIIVAGGRGSRFGSTDKVMAPLAGRPVLAHSLDAVAAATAVDAVVVVAGIHLIDAVRAFAENGGWEKLTAIVPGGDRRQDSVLAGISAVPESTKLVVVHDAARPLAAPALFNDCLAAADVHGAAIAAIPVSDTLKRVRSSLIVQTVDREDLWAAQTPQCFRLDLLRRAFAHAERFGLQVTDDAALVEALGLPVATVPGSPTNLKITRRQDLDVAEALMSERIAR